MSRVSRERNRRSQPPLSVLSNRGPGSRIINEISYPDTYTAAQRRALKIKTGMEDRAEISETRIHSQAFLPRLRKIAIFQYPWSLEA